jgi:nucleotide-binding universal stress UspA family protein
MTLWKRILVPLDESAYAELALPVAARLARAAGATVLLAQVVRAPLEHEVNAAARRGPRATTVPPADPQERAQAIAYLTRAAKHARLAGLATHTVVEAGPVVQTLLRVVHTLAVDVIVLSNQGQSGLSPWGLGSVAQQVAREAPVPVLVLRASAQGSMAEESNPLAGSLRALVPLDGSSYAEAALAPAASVVSALSAPAGGVLHLAGIAKSPAVVGEAQTYLRTVADGLGAGALARLNLQVSWSVDVHEDVAEALVQSAAQGPSALAVTGRGPGNASVPGTFAGDASAASDLIVMAPHGPGGPQRWALGSITERVLHTTRLPMLVVRPTHVAAEQMATLRPRDEPIQEYVRSYLDLISA